MEQIVTLKIVSHHTPEVDAFNQVSWKKLQ